MITDVLFDLDNTLYTPESGVMGRIKLLIHRWMAENLNLSEEEAETLRLAYLDRYGTTFRGLQLNYGIDPAEFLHFVHNPWVLEGLKSDPVLRQALLAVDAKRFIFTNSSRTHAERVIERLGLTGCFDDVIDIAMFDYVSKPAPIAYEVALHYVGVPAKQCLFAEDSVRNLVPAKQLGMYTLLVGQTIAPDGVADMAIPRLSAIAKVWPRFQQMAAQGDHYSGK